MLWPLQCPGKVLLLSEDHNFNAAYIRRSLEFCGVTVLTVADAPNRTLADLPDQDLASISGCVAVDFAPDALMELVARQWPFPLLFVGAYPGVPLAGGYAWMQAPFASYQVIERLMALLPNVK